MSARQPTAAQWILAILAGLFLAALPFLTYITGRDHHSGDAADHEHDQEMEAPSEP